MLARKRRLPEGIISISEQIREMAAGGMYFGGHSRSHPWFDWIDAGARRVEIKASADWIQQFEAGPWAFAYPYGGLSDDSPRSA